MQISRLFGIIYILMDRRSITARELADRFEVSTRTIYRDLDTLSQAGIPVYANKGKGGGICLVEGYVLNKSLISAQEQEDILSALRALSTVTFSDADQVLSKMSDLFRRDASDWIEIDFTDWGNNQTDTFRLLKRAIQDRRVVTFDYFNAAGEARRRSVEPQRLWFKHRGWYLKGFCRLRRDMRVFRITRMRAIQVEEEAFGRSLPEMDPVEAYSRAPVPQISLKLWIGKELSYRVFDEFGDPSFSRDENGDFIVSVTYPEDEWVYSFLQSFGPALKVLAPDYAREKLLDRVRRTLEVYRDDTPV